MYAILPLYLGRTPQPLKGEYYKQKAVKKTEKALRKHEPIKSKWRVTHQSYTPFDSVLLCLYLCVSFDLLKSKRYCVSATYKDT